MEEHLRLRGLRLGIQDEHSGGDFIDYDIGSIASNALEATKIAVLAFEQIVTGAALIQNAQRLPANCVPGFAVRYNAQQLLRITYADVHRPTGINSP